MITMKNKLIKFILLNPQVFKAANILIIFLCYKYYNITLVHAEELVTGKPYNHMTLTEKQAQVDKTGIAAFVLFGIFTIIAIKLRFWGI